MKIKQLKKHLSFGFVFVTIGGTQIDPPTGLRPELSGPGALGNIVSRFFLFVLPLVGIIGFLFFLWSGFQFLMSKGDPKAVEGAKQRLTYATVGLIVVFLAYTLTQFFLNFVGLRGS